MTTKIIPSKELFLAVEAADYGLASQLLEQGTDPNTSSDNGWTPLMLAILHDSLGMVKLLLENGADPNGTTRSEENPCRSPLAVAVSNGRLEAVKLLMAYQVNIERRDDKGMTAIDLAQKLSLRPLHRDKIMAILSLLQDYQTKSRRHLALPSGHPSS